jgi:predicted O-linked N-acetylglucosamine transferase (SPINDLY family)
MVIPGTLPERRLTAQTAFVFCSLNSLYKVEPVVFRCWANILRR